MYRFQLTVLEEALNPLTPPQQLEAIQRRAVRHAPTRYLPTGSEEALRELTNDSTHLLSAVSQVRASQVAQLFLRNGQG
jgi:hypothetical protein